MTTATMQSQTIATGDAIAQFMGCSRTKVYEIKRRTAAHSPVNHLGRGIRLDLADMSAGKRSSNGMDVDVALCLLPDLHPGMGRRYPGDLICQKISSFRWSCLREGYNEKSPSLVRLQCPAPNFSQFPRRCGEPLGSKTD